MRDTSLAAYESVKRHITANAKTIAGFILARGDYGATSHEIGLQLKMRPQSVSARVNELYRGNWITDSGDRRATDTGRKAIVWRYIK